MFISGRITRCGTISDCTYPLQAKWHFQERSFKGAIGDHWCGWDFWLTNIEPPFLSYSKNPILFWACHPKLFATQFSPVRFRQTWFGGASEKASTVAWLRRQGLLLLTFRPSSCLECGHHAWVESGAVWQQEDPSWWRVAAQMDEN